jgi:hypothetical protein
MNRSKEHFDAGLYGEGRGIMKTSLHLALWRKFYK